MDINILDIKILITSIWFDKKPKIKYGIDDVVINDIEVNQPITLTFQDKLSNGKHIFWIDFYNKENSDCVPEQNLDTAIIIESVIIENLNLDRFKWAAKYYPRYPKLLKLKQPNLESVRDSATYLGWNGIWKLEFEMPIFTWIHQLDNLGWLYEP
jgi:hypothetical protein